MRVIFLQYSDLGSFLLVSDTSVQKKKKAVWKGRGGAADKIIDGKSSSSNLNGKAIFMAELPISI